MGIFVLIAKILLKDWILTLVSRMNGAESVLDIVGITMLCIKIYPSFRPQMDEIIHYSYIFKLLEYGIPDIIIIMYTISDN